MSSAGELGNNLTCAASNVISLRNLSLTSTSPPLRSLLLRLTLLSSLQYISTSSLLAPPPHSSVLPSVEFKTSPPQPALCLLLQSSVLPSVEFKTSPPQPALCLLLQSSVLPSVEFKTSPPQPALCLLLQSSNLCASISMTTFQFSAVSAPWQGARTALSPHGRVDVRAEYRTRLPDGGTVQEGKERRISRYGC
ncbi:hypothetical protein RRG08_031402 [Elysia crispata]|uniref:Uncharacterized protein n=1 Tax=Elysia crispata TaxID=231223 RepID=A0AAE1DK57_9GAST|nr:hypothetical protein RRG08_031402 [Elysia crispata]